MRKPKSFQDSQGDIVSAVTTSAAQAFLMNLTGSVLSAPAWWSKKRDEWLNEFWRMEGNDLLAGAISTLTSKIVAANWYLEGPESLCKLYRNILLYEAEEQQGWDALISKWVEGFLVRDSGGFVEPLRASLSSTGPALGFKHIDESKLYPNTNPEYPFLYVGEKDTIKLKPTQFLRLVDMESGRDKDFGVGFSSVSRAISTAIIMMEIVRYKRERLSDLPPAAILFLSNLTTAQWEDIVAKYDTQQKNKGNETWRSLLVACGYDPEFPVHAEMFELSKLPEHYDERTATEMAIYTFALAFRVDPREFWPVSSGPLGTATEAQIQHKKAKAKGEGIIFSKIERALNNPLILPEGLKFRFDYRDDEEDMAGAEIAQAKLRNIRMMWESSPNRIAVQSAGTDAYGQPLPGPVNEGIITTEEARQLLIYEGLIPPEILGVSVEESKVYDVRSYGERVRLYRDGIKVPWKSESQLKAVLRP